MKICTKCGVDKPLSEFHRCAQSSDGRHWWCKTCKNKYRMALRAMDPEKHRAYEASRRRAHGIPRRPTLTIEERREAHRVRGVVYGKSETGKRLKALNGKRYRTEKPKQVECQRIVNKAIKDGRLIRQPCEQCGNTERVHGHHDNYDKPLDVRWLCPVHHGQHHANEKRQDSGDHPR